MKKLLIFLMAFSLFTACNNDKGKYTRDDKNADYRNKDDYGDADRDKENNSNDDGYKSDGWTKSDKRAFNEKCLSSMDNDEEKAKKYCPCLFEKFSKKYASMREIDERSNEAEGERLAKQCVEEIGGNTDNEETGKDKSDYAGSWTRSDENKFVAECFGTASKNVGETRANQYCDCMLDKIKKMYSSYNEANLKLGRMSQDQINRLAEDCNNQ